MKEKIKKEYLRRTRKLLKTKLYRRNLIQGINTCAAPLVRYFGPFLKRTREELKQMDQTTRKLMTMHKALYARDDVNRLCVKKIRRKRTYQYWRQCWPINTTTRRLYWKARLITATRNNSKNTRSNRTTMTRRQKWE